MLRPGGWLKLGGLPGFGAGWPVSGRPHRSYRAGIPHGLSGRPPQPEQLAP